MMSNQRYMVLLLGILTQVFVYYVQGAAPPTVLKKCTHWVGVEGCVYNMQLHPSKDTTCEDKDVFFRDCPNTVQEEDRTYCLNHEETCNKTCNGCGSDAYLSTKTIETTSPTATECLKFSCHHPYPCIKWHFAITPVPNGVYMQITEDDILKSGFVADTAACTAAGDVANLCLSVDFRRRFTFRGMKPTSWTDMKVCHATEYERTDTDTASGTCTDANGAPLGSSLNAVEPVLERESDRWKRIYFTIAPSDLCENRGIYVEITRGVDWFDVDNISFNINPDCEDNKIEYVHKYIPRNMHFNRYGKKHSGY